MFVLASHTGVFDRVYTSFLTTSKDPEQYHTAVETVAAAQLVSPMSYEEKRKIINKSHRTYAEITPAVEVAGTLVANFAILDTDNNPRIREDIIVDTFGANKILPDFDEIRTMYYEDIESGFLPSLMLVFSKNDIVLGKDIMITVLGFKHDPGYNFAVLTIDLNTFYQSTAGKDTGDDDIIATFPIYLDLRDLQMNYKITHVSSGEGVYYRSFLHNTTATAIGVINKTQNEKIFSPKWLDENK